MKKQTLALWFSILLILITSCKSVKTTTSTTTASNLTSKKLIANHDKNTFKYATLRARLKVRYKDDKKSFSPSVGLRMEKDKTIWLSAKVFGIVVAKVLITPTRVRYYEIVNNTYFDGDFSILSQWLGTDLDFNKVQNLLIGEALFNLKNEKYTIAIENQDYALRPQKELALFKRLFVIRGDNYKISRQQLTQTSKNRILNIDYPEYQEVGGQSFPKNSVIKAIEDAATTAITIDYRDVEHNVGVSFPFEIPSGAKEISIK